MAQALNALMDGPIASKETLNALEYGLDRLRRFNGCLHSPDDPSHSSSSFWFSISENLEYHEVANVDISVEKYQYTMQQFKLAATSLSVMARSIQLEMSRLRHIMQPIVLENGIAKLPDEILAQILLDAQMAMEELDYPPTLRLLQVCKRFANVVNRHPSFWAFVSSSMRPQELSGRLRRSGRAGLRIVIRDKDGGFGTTFFGAIVPHAQRWQSLLFYIYCGRGTAEIRRTCDRLDLPQLHELALYNYSHRAVTMFDYTTWNAPKLARIIVNEDVPIGLPLACTLVDCCLSLSGEHANDVRQLTPALVQFLESPRLSTSTSLSLSLPDTPQPLTSFKHIMPHLRTLQIAIPHLFRKVDEEGNSITNVTLMYAFVTNLEAPKLERFKVTLLNPPSWGEDYVNEFLGAIIRSRETNSLRSFEFDGARIDFHVFCGTVTSIFLHLDKVESILLSQLEFGTNATQQLPVANHKGPFALRSVHLRGCSIATYQLRDLLGLFSNTVTYPKFEGLMLSQCTGFSRSELVGTWEWEYFVKWTNMHWHAVLWAKKSDAFQCA